MALPGALKADRHSGPLANNHDLRHTTTTTNVFAATKPRQPKPPRGAGALGKPVAIGGVPQHSPTWLVVSEPDALVVVAA